MFWRTGVYDDKTEGEKEMMCARCRGRLMVSSWAAVRMLVGSWDVSRPSNELSNAGSAMLGFDGGKYQARFRRSQMHVGSDLMLSSARCIPLRNSFLRRKYQNSLSTSASLPLLIIGQGKMIPSPPGTLVTLTTPFSAISTFLGFLTSLCRLKYSIYSPINSPDRGS